MKRIAIAATAALAIGMAHAADVIEFKGVPLGSTKAALLAKFPSLICRRPPAQFWSLGEEHCSGVGDTALWTYAGVPARNVYFSIVGGRFEQFGVTFASNSFETVRSAIASTYGPGKASSRKIQTRGGASLDSQVWEVTAGGDVLTAFQHSSSLEEGAVGASSAAYRAWHAARMNSDPKKNAGDI